VRSVSIFEVAAASFGGALAAGGPWRGDPRLGRRPQALTRRFSVAQLICMTAQFLRFVIAAGVLLALTGCATQRPILGANNHLMRVGTAAAEKDIEDCMAIAETAAEAGASGNENVVAGAATSSVVGAAAGGAGGAVFGNAGQGAAAGAVGGAVGSLTHSLLQGLFRPKPAEPVRRNLTERCLRAKGYEPSGWN
jgi:hypothetical protein